MIAPERLNSLFRPRSVALVGAANKSTFSRLAFDNLVRFGFDDRTYLVNRRGAETHGRPTVTSCQEIGAPVDVAFMMVPQAGTLDALSDAAAAGIRRATRAVAIFMETVRDPATFRRAARRAAEAGQAIVVLKAGSSELSARTAAAHTGALVGDDRTIDAVFRDLGVIRVDSIEDMLITAGAAAALGPLDRPGIGVVSISGGACDIVADRADDLGAPLPPLAQQNEAALAEIMPAYGTVQNPLDVTGAAIIDPTIFTRSVAAMSQDPSAGVVAVVNGLPWQPSDGPYLAQVFVDAIGAGMQQAAVPCVYVNQVLQAVSDVTRASMAAGGVPYTIPGLRQMVVALRNVGWWSQVTREKPAAGTAVPVAQVRRGAWSEDAARRLLTDAGVPVVPAVLARSADEAAEAAADLGGPVVLKVCSPQILHKSDIGGARLGVVGDEVRAAYEAVAASAAAVDGAELEGVLVSPMRTGGVELLVGVVRDPQWGPMLAVALGGIFVEVLDDSALSPLPVTPATARRMLTSLRAAAVLDGVRGGAAADLDALGAVVARIGDLALALGDDLESLEVNPLRVDGTTVEALDAVVTWKERSR